MKKLVYVWMAFLAVTISISGCKQTAPKTEEVVADSDSIVVNEIAELDSTVYGVCGEGTMMNTVELITDGGDIGPDNGNGQWKWTQFAPPAAGIPRADGTRIVMCNRINRSATLHDFSDPSHPRQLKSWKFSGNPDIPVFHKGRVLIPCGYQGVLMQKAPPECDFRRPHCQTSGNLVK